MRTALRLILLAGLTTRLAAQDDDPKPTPEQVKAAADLKESVAGGLAYLANKQADDGSWSFGKEDSKIEATGLALTAFLGAGEAHRGALAPADAPKRLYTKHVQKAVQFLVKKMNKEGAFDGDNMVANAVAATAICETYGLTSDPLLKVSAQRALSYVVTAQNDKGGWGYKPRAEGNVTATGWNERALKSGHMAGLSVPMKTLQKIKPFLESVMLEEGREYAETPGGQPGRSAVAMVLLSRLYLGDGRKHVAIIKGTEALMKKGPPKDLNDPATMWFAMQVFHHLGGKNWEEWNKPVRDLLIKTQNKGKEADKGSWAPARADDATRLRSTAFALLTLEVYHRHLPLYRRMLAPELFDK